MTKDEFVFNFEKEVIENRLVFFLNWTFRKTAKAWTSKKVSQWYYTENQEAKYILSTILAIHVSGSNTIEQLTSWRGVQPFSSVTLSCTNTEEDSHPGDVFNHSHQWL